ncbi:hypothetical protein H9P43_007935 [Blastocladiella emersonii ATCC 22665]|nr:hypothetical protein H9P43_007935 [Blastocladiella emersonii ATCC 22665]
MPGSPALRAAAPAASALLDVPDKPAPGTTATATPTPRRGTVSSYQSLSEYVTSAAATEAAEAGDGAVDPLADLGDSHRPWYQRRATIAWLVGFSLFVDMVVYGAIVPILPSLAHDELDIDEASLGFLFGSYALGLLISTPPIAYLSDRYRNRKWPMVLGLAGLTGTTIMFALAKTYWQLLAARVLQGFSAGAPWTVGLSLLADVYPSAALGSVIGPVLACNHAGFLAGPVIGGWLFQYAGYMAPFAFAAALAAANLALRLVVDESPHMAAAAQGEVEPLLAHAGSDETLTEVPPRPAEPLGMLDLLRGRPVQLSILVTVVVGGIFSGLEPTLPLHLGAAYRLSPSAIGSVFVSLIVPSMFTSTAAGQLSDRYGGGAVLAVGLALLAILAPLAAIPHLPLWGMVCALVLFGGAQGFAMTPVIPAMARYVASRGSSSYASVYANFNLAYSVAILLGPSVAGNLYAKLGFAAEMWIFAGTLAALLVVIAAVGVRHFS